jgi:glyoxylase-like metal-dependent hydrolase (beta-lactamase superfamily II)
VKGNIDANTLSLRSVLFAALTALAIPATQSFAAAPQVKTSAPIFTASCWVSVEVTALSDGTVELPVDKLLTNTTPEKVGKALHKAHQHSPLETSVNAYLINTGNKLVLIDTGAGSLFGPTLGKMLSNLKAAGWPEQVDEIYITHMHPDHVGGLMNGETMVFPNAVVRADQHDVDFWLSQANLEKAPADAKGFFQGQWHH